MNMNTDRKSAQRKHSRFSFLLEEWVYQLALVAIVIGAVVERGLEIGGGTFI